MHGAVGAAVSWARADNRRRWRSLLVLGLIAGVTGGLALGCFVGAQRTGTALARLEDRTNASDAIVFSGQAGVYRPEWETLAARPEVDELAPWALVFGDIEVDDSPDELLFVPVGDQFLQTVDRPIVVEGRMWDPAADDELVVGEEFARSEGIGLGFTTGFQPFVEADYDENGERTDAPPQGPRLEMRVVGIIRTPVEHLFTGDGSAFAPPGLLARHPDLFWVENASVRLNDVPNGQAELLVHAESDIAPGVPILNLDVVGRRVTTTTDVERTVLLVLGGVILLAGLVLVGQVISRSASVIGVDAQALRSVGLSRRSIAFASAMSHLPAALLAGLTCAATTIATSTVVPFGLAGQLDPEISLRVSVAATVLGSIGLPVLLAAAAFERAWSAAGRPTEPPDDTRGVIGWVRRHSSVVIGLGTTMALRQPRRGGVTVRPALLGAIAGIVGVAGAATLDAGLDDALDHPERAGVVWDVTVLEADATVVKTEGGFSEDTIEAVRATAGVGEVALADRIVMEVGDIGAPAFVLRPVEGSPPIELTVLDGRAPSRRGEVAIGPATLQRMGAGIGDDVRIDGAHEVRVVGTALFPHDVHSGFDEGIWLTPADEGLLPAVHEDAAERFLAVRLSDGADPEATMEALYEAVGETGASVFPISEPPELLNLRDVVPLPRWVGAFLALLAIAALLHVLSSTARVRAHDFAVLRAIGMTRRSTRLILNVQGVATFAVGLLLGIPIGVAAGRRAWKLIASDVPIDVVTPVAVLAIAVLVPAALVVSQLVATGPGRRLRRLQPAEVLRSE